MASETSDYDVALEALNDAIAYLSDAFNAVSTLSVTEDELDELHELASQASSLAASIVDNLDHTIPEEDEDESEGAAP